MKIIEPETITKEVSRLCIEAATYIENDVLSCLKRAMNNYQRCIIIINRLNSK